MPQTPIFIPSRKPNWKLDIAEQVVNQTRQLHRILNQLAWIEYKLKEIVDMPISDWDEPSQSIGTKILNHRPEIVLHTLKLYEIEVELLLKRYKSLKVDLQKITPTEYHTIKRHPSECPPLSNSEISQFLAGPLCRQDASGLTKIYYSFNPLHRRVRYWTWDTSVSEAFNDVEQYVAQEVMKEITSATKGSIVFEERNALNPYNPEGIVFSRCQSNSKEISGITSFTKSTLFIKSNLAQALICFFPETIQRLNSIAFAGSAGVAGTLFKILLTEIMHVLTYRMGKINTVTSIAAKLANLQDPQFCSVLIEQNIVTRQATPVIQLSLKDLTLPIPYELGGLGPWDENLLQELSGWNSTTQVSENYTETLKKFMVVAAFCICSTHVIADKGFDFLARLLNLTAKIEVPRPVTNVMKLGFHYGLLAQNGATEQVLTSFSLLQGLSFVIDYLVDLHHASLSAIPKYFSKSLKMLTYGILMDGILSNNAEAFSTMENIVIYSTMTIALLLADNLDQEIPGQRQIENSSVSLQAAS